MGLLRVAKGSMDTVLADQWREYFYASALNEDILVTKGIPRQQKKSFNTKKTDNIITNGSVISVNEGQCMIIVDNGAIVEVSAEPGEFVWDASTEPSIFYGGLQKGIMDSFNTWKKRVGFGGDTAKDQRIYYFNTKDIIGNKYGTQSPIPFRVIDANIGLDTDVAVRCHGEYAYHLADPILFYKKVCGNVSEDFTRDRIDSQLKSELLTALQPAFAEISMKGVRYSQLPAYTGELTKVLHAELSKTWGTLYGIEITSFGINSATISEEDAEKIKTLQMNATLRSPQMAAATLAAAQAQAMQDAAKNQNAGPMMAFAGLNMANMTGGINAASLYQMGGQSGVREPQAPGEPDQMPESTGTAKMQPGSWICPKCGNQNAGNFCSNCGTAKPEPTAWVCSCGTQNIGNFCTNCGKPRNPQ